MSSGSETELPGEMDILGFEDSSDTSSRSTHGSSGSLGGSSSVGEDSPPEVSDRELILAMDAEEDLELFMAEQMRSAQEESPVLPDNYATPAVQMPVPEPAPAPLPDAGPVAQMTGPIEQISAFTPQMASMAPATTDMPSQNLGSQSHGQPQSVEDYESLKRYYEHTLARLQAAHSRTLERFRQFQQLVLDPHLGCDLNPPLPGPGKIQLGTTPLGVTPLDMTSEQYYVRAARAEMGRMQIIAAHIQRLEMGIAAAELGIQNTLEQAREPKRAEDNPLGVETQSNKRKRPEEDGE